MDQKRPHITLPEPNADPDLWRLGEVRDFDDVLDAIQFEAFGNAQLGLPDSFIGAMCVGIVAAQENPDWASWFLTQIPQDPNVQILTGAARRIVAGHKAASEQFDKLRKEGTI